MRTRPAALALVVSLASAASALAGDGDGAPGIAVLDFSADGKDVQLATALSGVAANELQRLGTFQVTTAESARRLMSFERQKQLLGAGDDPTALSALGDALGARYLLSGRVARLEGDKGRATFSVELELLDAKLAKRVSSAVKTGPNAAELSAALPAEVLKLVSPLLSGRRGDLVVTTVESGAAVKVDGALVGVTPLAGRHALPAGPHLLTVEKAGFVTEQREVRISEGKVAAVEVRLVPSPDFAEAYERSASNMRLGAWLSTGAAVAGVGSAIFFQTKVASLYGRPDEAGTFQFHRAKVQSGVELEGDVNHRERAQALSGQIQSSRLYSYVGYGVGGAAAVAATFFFISGDAPGRYEQFRAAPSSEAAPQVVVLPSPDGVHGAFSLRF